MYRERRPMKQVVNDALRQALAQANDSQQAPYRLEPHESALQPGLDLAGFNRLADEFEDEAIITSATRSS